ncbi:hypothetical protein BDV95DRAFT_499569 [Massariosphaeria phaeospora]|uniref:Cytochrome c oxidase assembly protein COX20, mitochondrial n=1 Tax=Massariosphaeria phaeospora TaxID=100035 RepID=A0A7C8IBD8_9PLEO|nr:hypothetical protein BDV95DRAFT_499569 [Massariosphaeria phaeospora]
MADDTRQPDASQPSQSPQSPPPPPPHPKTPANTMPGGSAHTAGGTPAESELSYVDVVRTLGPEYYLNFHKRPCVRDSQLTGIAAGFVGGSVGAIVRRPVSVCSNWAVLSWVGVSCASYQYCQYVRSKEKDGMRMARELMDKKRVSVEAKREARKRAQQEQLRVEEERRAEDARRKSWGYWLEKNVRFW